MNGNISAVWSGPSPEHTNSMLREILRPAADRERPLQVFFRADDIARIDEPFSRLMHLFQSNDIPLCLAVVPDWIDQAGWQALQEFEPRNPLWCWHQHGRSHTNHEKQGKKCEFGDSRSREAVSNDLSQGRERLVSIMGETFFPVFTPPWNRCGPATLELLREKGFRAVSRSKGAKPAAEGILPDLAVNVDLHTRKENNFTEGWQNLTAEFGEAAESGRMGIMLHHELMNEEAFSFLAVLLAHLRSSPRVSCCTFRELC